MIIRSVLLWTMAPVLVCGCARGGDSDGGSPGAGPAVAAAPDAGGDTDAEQHTEGRKLKEHRSGDWTPGLTDEEKDTLFAIARDVLAWSIKGRKGRVSMDDYALTPKLKEDCATFVTFKNRGRLRGCVGCLVAVEPMYMSVRTSAGNAATDSRFRFNPITERELPEIEIHVSLLSPMKPIESLDEFKIGAHGIVMEKGLNRAVYLPEVAVEQKWSRDETLSSLSEKAGLDAEAWRQGARFKIFSSVVLSEE